MKYKVACVIVTFNRKELLIRCLNAVSSQKYKPHTVFIIDNASTDGTAEFVELCGYYNTDHKDIKFKYNLLDENIGGAGGFYTGMKLAYDSSEKFDAIWVMDDDGIPDNCQLEKLCKYLPKHHYIAPLVLSIEEPDQPAFYSFESLSKYPQDIEGNYIGASSPFNGILYSRYLIETIGYPKKEMFIWGDEVNYDLRAGVAGFTPIMIKKAIHCHPKDRQIKFSTWGNRKIVVPNEDWKLYCLIRNRVYNTTVGFTYFTLIKRIISEFMDYTFYFLKNGNRNKLKIIVTAIIDGAKKDFSLPRKFLDQ